MKVDIMNYCEKIVFSFLNYTHKNSAYTPRFTRIHNRKPQHSPAK